MMVVRFFTNSRALVALQVGQEEFSILRPEHCKLINQMECIELRAHRKAAR